ncbi:MAG: 7-cyano-7-deazaguanine synthase [Acidobacteria bacterium]|nr:7-cyano-7-deazaguanine synthase [Acidobacteriota bacterium]
MVGEITARGLRLESDSFGRVPLFWTTHNGSIWFSTELSLLIEVTGRSVVDPQGLYGYACFSYVPAPLTPIEGIAAVPAGETLCWQAPTGTLESTEKTIVRKSLRTHEWCEDRVTADDEDLAVSALRRLLTEAIESQVTDVSSNPVGVFLSGGLDSSIVAALLVRAGVKVKAYSLDFGNYGLPELEFAEAVASYLRIPLVKVPAHPKQIRQALEATVHSLQLPFGDGVTVPLYLLGQAASRDVQIVFNGEGGDQLFAGWTNKPLIAAGVYQASAMDELRLMSEYLKTFHRLQGYESSVFTDHMLTALGDLSPIGWIQPALDGGYCQSFLHRMRRAGLMLKGAQNIQPRATRLAWVHGLDVRSPFCSYPLAEWTFQLSGELCLRGPCEKYLLKRAVEPWLPGEIVWREKRGMGVPLTEWCLGPLWGKLGCWLNTNTLGAEDHWQADLPLRVALGQFSGHIQGRRIGEILWLLLVWQVWRKTVAGEKLWSQPLRSPFRMPFPILRFLERALVE